MVCIYCGSPTKVTNSRLQKQANQVWRRRQCLRCKEVFTTHEGAELGGSLAVSGHNSNELIPFSRDKLFVSIYESLRHRPSAISDASALTATIIARLVLVARDGHLKRHDITTITTEVLGRFDTTAATVYAAYHKQQA